jgi:endonuclease-8
MSEGGATQRSASALRTALAGQRMVRFDAPKLIGPVPQAGRIIEHVECHGRHLEITWDDGLVLDTNLRMSGSWHLYRRGGRWRHPYEQIRAAVEVEDWVAVCFSAPIVETHRLPDRRRHPGMGRLGTDLCQPGADLGAVVNLLLTHPEPETRLAEILLDQRVMRRVGNVFRCEVLWVTELSPYAKVGSLTEHDAIRVVNTVATMLRTNLHQEPSTSTPGSKGGLAVYGRNGQRCQRCGGTVDCRQMGEQNRILYWCAGCQVHLDPKLEKSSDDTPMDPHPAAQRYLADLPWNRDVG